MAQKGLFVNDDDEEGEGERNRKLENCRLRLPNSVKPRSMYVHSFLDD